MADSFTKKYRDSNNGNFPSLNLTHKEVGGSFYTVREIVREIIQENKVLRPGSSTLRTLKFEDCLDLEEVAVDYMNPNETDQTYGESYSLATGIQTVSKESYEEVDSVTLVSSDPNDYSSLKAVDTKSSGHLDANSSATYLKDSFLNVEHVEGNQRKLSWLIHGNSEAHELLHPEGQGRKSKDCNNYEVELQVPLCKSASVTYPSSEFRENAIGNKINGMPGKTNSFVETKAVSEIANVDTLLETKILTNSVNSSTLTPFEEYSDSSDEVLSLADVATKTCRPNNRSLPSKDLST